MIVDPDFFDHWRTAMLIDALNKDAMAPMYVLRLWAHCQNRKSTHFSMPAKGIKALCRYVGDAEVLEASLIEAGFLEREGEFIEVIGWAEHNSKLIANWRNGASGGRPPKTEQEPTQNPNGTQQEPSGTQTKPIGEDEIGEDVSNPNGLDVASDAADLLGDSQANPCPHKQIIALYHEVLPMCPRIRDWTPARAMQLRARWNEDKKRQSLDWWRKFFEYVAQCDFLIGKTPKPFFADLEWLTKSANFTKTREGKYESRDKQ